MESETRVPDKQESNPLGDVDKNLKRIEPDIETDKFPEDEQKEIVRMVIQDADADKEAMAEWVEQRVKDLQMYNGEKPSLIEGLNKKAWQSDRNLGLCMAICDAYQATLLATCYNVDTIHYRGTEENDVNNADSAEQFSKWGLDNQEADFFPEADDFIHNRITQGFSAFKVYWEVWYEWVDKRIPKYDGKTFKGYDIKTEKQRFERGVIENIENVDDLLTPAFGKDMQDLSHIIHVLHLTSEDILDMGERKIFTNVDKKYVESLKGACLENVINRIGKEKAAQLGLTYAQDITSADLRVFPVDVYEWYGYYTKNGKREKYRFTVEPTRHKFLSGKPLRKVPGFRDGKYPFVGGALIRRPGYLRGLSIPKITASIINALNNIYNQKSDFQFVENCPVGFFKPDENFDQQNYELEPGNLYPSASPKDVNFPNLGRSMAWAESDIQLLLEVLERLTGAASYFMSNSKGVSGTATRDSIINEKSETRFGLWVKRIIDDISEAITMWYGMYQDCAPSTLGERVIGEDGKKLFTNLSIDTLRGMYRAYLTPDIISGSKTLEKQIALWTYGAMAQNMWFNPQINPRGNWELTADIFKKIGVMNIESYMPPKPKNALGESKEVNAEFTRIMRGEVIEPPEGTTPGVVEHYHGHMKQKEERYNELDEEYKVNFDVHMFKTFVNFQEYMAKRQTEMIENQLAMQMIDRAKKGLSNGEGQPGVQTPPVGSMGVPNQDTGMEGVSGINEGASGVPPGAGELPPPLA